MDRDEVRPRFDAVVAELIGVDIADIDLSRTWESMDVDSLALTEVAIALCDEFEICLPDVDNDQIETVGHVFDLTIACVNDPSGTCELPARA